MTQILKLTIGQHNIDESRVDENGLYTRPPIAQAEWERMGLGDSPREHVVFNGDGTVTVTISESPEGIEKILNFAADFLVPYTHEIITQQ
jgi:hypothetical protein